MQLRALLPSALLVLAATAVPVPDDSTASVESLTSTCRKPYARKEWRTLSNSERQEYIDAVKCLQNRPSQTSATWKGASSRYDDFVALHISQTDYIHWVGLFLPWHRHFLWLYEQELRDVCCYNGGVPYWDWTLDTTSEAAVLKSPIFDSQHGFGGNGAYIEDLSFLPAEYHSQLDVPGRTGGGCVTDGPWANHNVTLGPGNSTAYNSHCLRRDVSPYLMTIALNASRLNWVLDAPTFWELDHRTESYTLTVPDISVHGGGHLGVGGNVGEIANTYSSPSDPLFWSHHANLDRMWNTWQRKNWAVRKSDIGGPDTSFAYPFNWFGDIPYKNVTLNTPLQYSLIDGVSEIADTMDIQGGDYCYTYA
ncbi:Di-copper centre-containing protein [Thozetella sp. PMI_491]|nr:Di-copper centre-containing protein [Thozetella sp. PMI_491]